MLQGEHAGEQLFIDPVPNNDGTLAMIAFRGSASIPVMGLADEYTCGVVLYPDDENPEADQDRWKIHTCQSR